MHTHMTVDGLVLNVNQCELNINGESISLTPIEFKMLHFFMKHPNKAFTRDQLIMQIWGTRAYIDSHMVETNIRRLRDKLQTYGYHWIKTVHNTGYFLMCGPR